ncbi:MAG TPA: dinitrogenase iron-molybdenum cofactor [Moorella mulderi]|nr:dinitrogenase iron-molybdenum cofactor [Moorella mulderi]
MEGKVAIAAMGPDKGAEFSRHFATAPYFLIYDPASKEVEAVENKAREMPAGRGAAAAQLLMDKGVKAVVVEHIGPRPFNMLKEAGIKVYPGPEISVEQILEALDKGQMAAPLEAPTESLGSGEGCGC